MMIIKGIFILLLVVTPLVIADELESDDSIHKKQISQDAKENYFKYLLWGHALANSKHNLILGTKSLSDKLLNKQVIKKSSSWIPLVRVSDKYDYSLQTPGYITYVEVLDKSINGKGGYAALLSGGPGFSNVSISFQSQRNEPLNFIVNVYGQTKII